MVRALHAGPEPLDVDDAIARTAEWWASWLRDRTPSVMHTEAVRRSLLVLRLLTHVDTGGVVAAVTTSLPETPRGSRNWDYRYVWLRDAALTLEALMNHRFVHEAGAWRRWLLRAIAGDPADVQIMYGLAGERRLPEWEVEALPGYRGASPVRIGNAASEQFQADVYGEVMIALDGARHVGLDEDEFSWSLQLALLREVERNLERPDHGIWEIRGEERRFTHSRAMLWAALDRGICAVEHDGRRGPVEQWRLLRARLEAEIEDTGFDRALGSYVQYAGSHEVDAALLQLPQIGYLAHDDPRMLGTVARIEQTLLRNGLLRRYRTEADIDGVPGDENAFVACSFWLVEQYAHTGRLDGGRGADGTVARLPLRGRAALRRGRPAQRPARGQHPAGPLAPRARARVRRDRARPRRAALRPTRMRAPRTARGGGRRSSRRTSHPRTREASASRRGVRAAESTPRNHENPRLIGEGFSYLAVIGRGDRI